MQERNEKWRESRQQGGSFQERDRDSDYDYDRGFEGGSRYRAGSRGRQGASGYDMERPYSDRNFDRGSSNRGNIREGWQSGGFEGERYSDFDDETFGRGQSSRGSYGGGYGSGSDYGYGGYGERNQRGSSRGWMGSREGAYQSTGMGYGQDESTGSSQASRYSPYSGMSRGSRFENRGEHRGKGPRSFNRSDDRICEDVCERLTNDDDIDASEIEVDVQSGKVVLRGTVDQRQHRYQAEELASSVWGVKDVENQLRVESQHSRSGSHVSGQASGKGGRSHDSESHEGKKKDKAA